MIIHEIIRLITKLNLKVDGVAIVLVAIACYIFYRKSKRTRILIEEKNLLKKQMLVIFITFSYIILIFDVTLLNRGIYVDKHANFNLFSSYRQICDTFNKSSLQHIILNILMTVPLGILLPLLHNKFYKVKWTMAAGIIFILAIEFTQLKTNSGVFDVDDIFNNSIGILIGYCTIMSVLNIRKGQKNRFSKALKYTLPLFIMTIIFAGMVIYYNTKEFGILKLPGYIKMNTKNVDIKFETGLDSGEYMIPIYKAPDFNSNKTKIFAESFFKNINTEGIELEEDLYTNLVYYWLKTNNNNYVLMIKFLDGSYDYTNFLKHEETEYINMDEKILLEELSYFNIKIPEGAIFSSQNDNTYTWKIDKHIYGDLLTDGQLECICYDDGTIETIKNNIITYTKVKDVLIISEKEAAEKILKGNAWIFFSAEEINSIKVLDVYMDYKLDSKGFYRPVYIFNCKGDGQKFEIVVDILK
ncbi:VanZ family protein [Tissierella sp.]|uniref:VanZ family protein n=1 Tax=Tissierella sp. TaxID=41274 RepID=UPI0028A8CE56|nr:VanZ family protein [Tissierella sp.]